MSNRRLYPKTKQFSVRLTLKDEHHKWLCLDAKTTKGGKAAIIRKLLEASFKTRRR